MCYNIPKRYCFNWEGPFVLITREMDYALRILRALEQEEQLSAALYALGAVSLETLLAEIPC